MLESQSKELDLERLIELFQSAALPQSEWTHRAHLRVALFYLRTYSPEESLKRLREAIQNLNLFHGVYTNRDGGYHETRTRVWLAVLRSCLQEDGGSLSDSEIVNRFAKTDVATEYYSKQALHSWEARLDWMPPDLKPLPIDPGSWCPKTPELFTLRS
jgi:hypothetical protein